MSETKRYAVAGAGEVIFGLSAHWCAQSIGPHVGCSWSRYGDSGGTMDIEEARRLHADLGKFIAEFDAEGGRQFFKEKLEGIWSLNP